MARGIYEITLKTRYFPALSAEDALELHNCGDYLAEFQEEDVEINLIVKEEHTMQLFLLAKTMYDMDKFEHSQVKTTVGALAMEMGYVNNHEEVADCVLTWVERFDDMTLSDVEEWIIG